MSTFGKQSLASLHGVHPKLGLLMTEAIKNTPHDFTITDGGRTAAMQKALWLKGRNAAGKIVNKSLIVTQLDGYIKKSNHQAKEDGYYHAVDLYPFVDGKIDFNDTHSYLPIIAAHILETAKRLNIKIGWGGAWKATKTSSAGWDKPHFELL